MRGVQTSRYTWSRAAGVDDAAPGILLATFAGTVIFASGEAADFAGIEVVDASQPDEPFAGSATILCADGSVSHQDFSGWLEARDGGVLRGSGRWSFLSGTGRFADLTGSGGVRWTIEDDVWRAEFFPTDET